MKTFWIGIFISTFYAIGLVITIQGLGLKPMSSWNEFGDFLAGAFSPIAFLWLILGYLQQQRELQQNTRALEIQAEELKNSVLQYKAMVKVAREQLDNDREVLISAKKEKEIQYKPIIKPPVVAPAVIIGDDKFRYNSSLMNVGAKALNVQITTEPSLPLYDNIHLHSLDEGFAELRSGVEVLEEDLLDIFILTIKYESTLGVPYSDIYTYKLSGKGKYTVIDDYSL